MQDDSNQKQLRELIGKCVFFPSKVFFIKWLSLSFFLCSLSVISGLVSRHASGGQIIYILRIVLSIFLGVFGAMGLLAYTGRW
jgi:hypothetical protein